jgi:hypothetical protein
VNRAAEATPGWAAPLPDDSDPENTFPPAEDPALCTLVPPNGTADAEVLGAGAAVPVAAEAVVTFGSVVVTFGTVVVTFGTVVVTFGTVVVTFGTVVVTFGIVVVTFGTVVVTGSVVVTLGSVVVTGSVVEMVGSTVVINSGTAERPRMGALAKKPRRRSTARAAARLTGPAYPHLPRHNPKRP